MTRTERDSVTMEDMRRFELLEQMVTGGIAALGRELARALGREPLLVDAGGMEHFPRSHEPAEEEIQAFLDNLPEFGDGQYYYGRNQSCLALQVSCSDGTEQRRLFVLLREWRGEDIPRAAEAVQPFRLALHHYIKLELRVQRRLEDAKQRFLEDIFLRNSVCLETLVERLGPDFDPKQHYAILLAEFTDSRQAVKETEFHSFLARFSAAHKTERAYPLLWQGMYLAVLTGSYRQDNFQLIEDWPSTRLIRECQRAFTEQYHAEISIGVGGIYPVPELHKSYNEARIAVKFHTIKGRRGFVQRFADLGIFRELFLHDTERITAFCRLALGKLLEYDHDNDADLRTTLTTLLDAGMNYKLAAERLFVHVNTVRYRCEKIEQILGVDLQDPDNIFNFYAALRVGDVLTALDLMQPGYVGELAGSGRGVPHKKSRTVF